MAKVLVVDDQENIVRLLELALGGEHQVITAYNGEQAMEAVRSHRPDVVVLDIIMPVLDGYRVLHRIKSNPETEAITVIMLTQKDQPDDIVLGFTVGADYYIPKPFNATDVASLIRRHLAAREGEA
jgi:DNA-binding response OmpR family regulator